MQLGEAPEKHHANKIKTQNRQLTTCEGQTSKSCRRAPANATRLRALALYKELQYLARHYPDPSYNYHARIRGLFEKNRHLTDNDKIESALKLGEHIRKETLALYSLQKYRHLKRMYPDWNPKS